MIIVTGAAGFIGACLIKCLNERGYFDIIAVDDFAEPKKWKNLTKIGFQDFIHKDDLLNKFNKINNISTVYHLGAISSTTFTDGDYIFRNNYEYTKHLCKLSIKAGARFIYASSAATYGTGEFGYDDYETGLVNLRPLNLYGYSKHMFDLFAQRNNFFDQYGIIGLKYFNVYGPLEDHKGDMRSVVLKSYLSYLQTGKVNLFKSNNVDIKDGDQKRDFIYVKDAVKMTYRLASRHNTKGGIYNIGTGVARSFNDIIASLSKALDKNIDIEYVDMPASIAHTYQNFTQANIEKFKLAIAPDVFAPVSLEVGVADYVEYIKSDNFTIAH